MKEVSAALFVVAFIILTAGTSSSSIINPTEDASTLKAFPDDNNGFGYLWTGETAGSESRTYLKFDLFPFPSIKSASLWLNSYTPLFWGPSADVTVYAASNDWTEGGLKWNNQPLLGTQGGTTTVEPALGWYSWEVTPLAQSSKGGIFSLALISDGVFRGYYSKDMRNWPSEGINNIPFLDITSVPEPISVILFLSGGSVLAVRRINRKK